MNLKPNVANFSVSLIGQTDIISSITHIMKNVSVMMDSGVFKKNEGYEFHMDYVKMGSHWSKGYMACEFWENQNVISEFFKDKFYEHADVTDVIICEASVLPKLSGSVWDNGDYEAFHDLHALWRDAENQKNRSLERLMLTFNLLDKELAEV